MANGRVEQLVARRAHNPEVAGSSPASAITPALAGHSQRSLIMTTTVAATLLKR